MSLYYSYLKEIEPIAIVPVPLFAHLQIRSRKLLRIGSDQHPYIIKRLPQPSTARLTVEQRRPNDFTEAAVSRDNWDIEAGTASTPQDKEYGKYDDKASPYTLSASG